MLSTVEWDGGPSGTGTNWHVPANWVGDALPTAADDVIVGTEFAGITIDCAANVTINSIDGHANTQITAGTFSVASASFSNGLTLAGGTLSGGGDLTATSHFAWSAGSMAGTGQTIIAAAATGTISGASTKYLARTLENSGTVNYVGAGLTLLSASDSVGVIDNLADGIFNAAGEGDFSYASSGGGSGGQAFHNAGTFHKTGSGTTTKLLTAVAFNNTGTVDVQEGTLDLPGSLVVDGQNFLQSLRQATLSVYGQLVGDTTNADLFTPQGTTRLDGPGSLASPDLLEVMGQNLGAVPSGFVDNFGYGRLVVASNYVRLVDTADNAAGEGDEALYANELVVAAGKTLDLNGLDVCVRKAQLDGTIVGGTIQLLPDGGSMPWNTVQPGKIEVAGEMDAWTFFGRAGQSVAVVLDTGSGSLPSPLLPHLGNAQVQLFDAQNNLLGTGSADVAGEQVRLPILPLPTDGDYRLEVSAPAAQPDSTGNYAIGVWDATVVVAPISLGQRYFGQIETPYSVDRWTFSAVANQQIQFDLVAVSHTNVRFQISGPNDWIGFIDLDDDSGLLTLPYSGSYVLEAVTSGDLGVDYAFRMDETVRTQLSLGVRYIGMLAGSSQAQLFQVQVPDRKQLWVQLDDVSSANRNEVYVKLGSPPTRSDYDVRFDTLASADQEILVPAAVPGNWYILVYSESTPEPGEFSLLVNAGDIFLKRVTPDHYGNSQDATLTITGTGFAPSATVELVATDQTAYAGTVGDIVTSTQLTVARPLPRIRSIRMIPHKDPAKEALVTIDAETPSSSVAPLPAEVEPGFVVSWSGATEVGGSGVARYDIYVSEAYDGQWQPYTRWLSQTKLTEAPFVDGKAGRQYRFYSVAIDAVGHKEAASTTADTHTQLANSAVNSHHLFYNHSAWDGNDDVANASDDNAMAADTIHKRFVLSGDMSDSS